MVRDLDLLSVPSRASADYAVHEPVNAWKDAAEDVLIWMIMANNILIQFGQDAAGGAFWQRWRDFSDSASAWSRWEPTLGEPEPEPEPEVK
jgi:hypothetical protein